MILWIYIFIMYLHTISVENFKGLNFRGFSILIQKLNSWFSWQLVQFIHRNVKVPSIETEIENGEDASEDATGPHYIKNISPVAALSSQLVSHAAIDNAPARMATPRAMRGYLPSPCRYNTRLVRNLHLTLQNGSKYS